MLPVALVVAALALALRVIPNSRETPGHGHEAMWAGVAVMGVLFLYVLTRGPKNPEPEPEPAAAPEVLSAR